MATLKSGYRLALEEGAHTLADALSGLGARDCLARTLERFPGEVCVVSSFGAESAVILHMVSEVAPGTPVLLLDTGKLFDQTLEYRDTLTEHLGLQNVRAITPNPDHIEADDPDGNLHARKPDLCCHIRKTLPLIRALTPFKVWISGRKRHHGAERSDLNRVEVQDGKLKLNPLYDWSADRVTAYLRDHDLPRHPLVAAGYPSIGCLPCTQPVSAGDDPRAGRWVGLDKTECGIHLGPDGRIRRSAP